jgi:hypothetical protein
MDKYFFSKQTSDNKKPHFLRTILVTLTILIMAGILSYQNCSKSHKRHELTAIESLDVLTEVVDDTLSKTERWLQMVGKQIKKMYPNPNLKDIETFLHDVDVLQPTLLGTSYFAWANPEGEIVVGARKGIVLGKRPSIKHRKYFVTARNTPWTVQLSLPETSVMSGVSWVLPHALGVTNDADEFLGYVTLGLKTKELVNYIWEKYTAKHPHTSDETVDVNLTRPRFMLVDENLNVILDDFQKEEGKSLKPYLGENFKFTETQGSLNPVLKLKRPFSTTYTFYKKVPNYDLYILLQS